MSPGGNPSWEALFMDFTWSASCNRDQSVGDESPCWTGPERMWEHTVPSHLQGHSHRQGEMCLCSWITWTATYGSKCGHHSSSHCSVKMGTIHSSDSALPCSPLHAEMTASFPSCIKMTGAVSNPHSCSGCIRSQVNHQAIFFLFLFPLSFLLMEVGGGVPWGDEFTRGRFFSNCLKVWKQITEAFFFLLIEYRFDFLI